MAKTKKSTDGVFWKRGGDRGLEYYWQIGTQKSKLFRSKTDCAMDYVTKYVDKYPKYKELVYDKSWDQIFAMFGIKAEER